MTGKTVRHNLRSMPNQSGQTLQSARLLNIAFASFQYRATRQKPRREVAGAAFGFSFFFFLVSFL